ncbi:DUF1036 domain-containing protein [Jannaschia pohangensis]|uniref:Uncharacterized membrane protein n=1 Tax=Jannaschia pohangensis TaxID=390807 RepID=A0A1I3UI81_9RHOB|nr:DUF1036 domain-containing protein [Jannaschia pohangensis]SFJ83218.1 Uncharacterized membrane protein [Jannaschia pohangensis]
MRRILLFLGVLVLLSAGGFSRPAMAQFTVCNQSFDVVNLALGRFDVDVFETRGWWTVGPNQCVDLIEGELSVRFVYVFAKDVFGRPVLPGGVPMCLGSERFVIRGEQNCLARGYQEARFQEVDTRKSERWTLFLAQPG